MERDPGSGPRSRCALLPVLLVALAAMACMPRPAARPNIVLISLESLRPDHLAFYSGERETAPALGALAAEGVVYEDAHSVTSWTLAAHASMFTGLYPPAHQARLPRSRLGDSYTTLAEILTAAGYQSVGVASGPYLRKEHNLHQGFELYDDSASSTTHATAHGDVTNPRMEAALVRFLEELRDPDRPFFLFAYFWDPHYDYIPPAPYDRLFVDDRCEPVDVSHYETSGAVHPGITGGQLRFLLSQYDGEIRWTDDHLARFFGMLRDKGLWDNTIIIVTSDHGEEFFDHGSKGHKKNLYAESVHVPLIVKYAGSGPTGRDGRLVSLVDLFPTILDLAGASSPVPHQGRSLLAPASADRTIFFELLSLWYLEGQVATSEEWVAIRRGHHKLIGVPGRARLELYDVRSDPGESHSVIESEQRKAQEMLSALNEWRRASAIVARRFEGGGEAALSDEALERLRSLGYVQ